MDLAERLLDPQTVEEALGEIELNNFDFSQIRDAIRELHRRLEAAKAEGAAEAYEAEAAYWEEMRERALSMADLSTSYQFRRRRDEARERAAALRKQVQG